MSEPRFSFVARVDDGHEDPATCVAWRLLGRNNHEIARSADGFADIAEARAAARSVAEHRERLHASVWVRGSERQWTWQLSLDGVSVAVSGRAYRREREAAHSLEQFLDTVGIARMSGDLHARPASRSLVRPEFRVPAYAPRHDDLALAQDVDDLALVRELADQEPRQKRSSAEHREFRSGSAGVPLTPGAS